MKTALASGVIPPVGSGRGAEIVRLLLHYGFALGLTVVVLGFGLKSFELSESKQAFNLPAPENKSQVQSVGLMDWWRSNNQKLLSQKGELNSARYLTVWSQYFPKGRVIYNHVDGWALIVGGPPESFRKVQTPGDKLITSGPENSTLEKEVLKEYLLGYSDEQKERIKELVRKRKLLGGIGTVFIRDYLYRELGWPRYEEYLEREVVFGEATDYFVFIGLQNRPGDKETACAIRFDESNGQYTKQTNSSHVEISNSAPLTYGTLGTQTDSVMNPSCRSTVRHEGACLGGTYHPLGIRLKAQRVPRGYSGHPWRGHRS